MRRAIVRVALAALACAGLGPAWAGPHDVLGADDARHLLARTGFGPTAADVADYAPLTRAQAVERLLATTHRKALLPPPASMASTEPLRYPGPQASVEARRAFNQRNVRDGLELRAWWMQEMASTPSPLTERMTLFWHNHFVSSQQKVRFARLMYGQNVLLREHALGSFATLLHAVAKDPAMLVYLDVAQNRRGQPNENFAREVMELFMLGEGRYGEQDVKEAARAFTGWSVDRDSGAFVFRRALHDGGRKTVLGHSGRFDGDDVLDLLLARPETATHVVGKLWREFVAPDDDAAEIARIAARFRASGYDLRVALRELLTGDAFYAPQARGALVKSPVELVVGALRQLGLAPDDGLPLALAAAQMGQNLCSPSNVKGWPGGEAWINATTLLARKQYLERLARGDAPGMGTAARRDDDAPASLAAAFDDASARQRRSGAAIERGLRALAFDPAAFVARQPGDDAAKRQAVQALLLPLPPQAPPPHDAPPALVVRATLLDPAFQLK